MGKRANRREVPASILMPRLLPFLLARLSGRNIPPILTAGPIG
jgi:hypothetical protein